MSAEVVGGLRFWEGTSPVLGEVLDSPVADDFGQVIGFCGRAVVAAREQGWGDPRIVTVWLVVSSALWEDENERKGKKE